MMRNSRSAAPVVPTPAATGWELVEFDSALVGQLQLHAVTGYKSLPRRGLEVGGLLFGREEQNPEPLLFLDSLEPIVSEHRSGPSLILSDEDRQGIQDLFDRAVRSGRHPVGLYRSHTAEEFTPRDEDLDLLRQLFPNGPALFLLLQPEGARIRHSCLYTWNPERNCLFASEVQELFSAPLPVVPQQELARVPQESVRPRKSSYKGLGWLMALILALPLCAWYFLGYSAADPESEPAPVSSAPLVVEPLLHIQPQGDRLLLQWDRGREDVKTADHGILEIRDRGQVHRVLLDGDQLRAGQFDYRPESADVRFRLQLYAGEPGTVSSVQSTQPLPPPTADAPETTVKPAPESARLSEPKRSVPSTPAVPEPTADRSLDLPPDPGQTAAIAPAAPNPGAIPLPPPPAHHPAPKPEGPATVAANVSIDPVPPDGLRQAIDHVPGLRWLQRRRFKAGDQFSPARALQHRAPTFPLSDLNKVQGDSNVAFRIRIERTGEVSDVLLLSNRADRYLVSLALDALDHWTFAPAQLADRPVDSELFVQFAFPRR